MSKRKITDMENGTSPESSDQYVNTKLTKTENVASSPTDSLLDKNTAVPIEMGAEEYVPRDHFLTITEHNGDLFAAPDKAVLIHACNCQGVWGTGIAAVFRQRYPKAFQQYAQHCTRKGAPVKPGTAFLIPPVEEQGPRHYIGCLFTSRHYGKRKDPPGTILRNTKAAVEDLFQKIKDTMQNDPISEMRMCQINSGAFKVPWNRTLEVITGIPLEEGTPSSMTIWSL